MYKDCITEESARRQRQLELCLQDLMLTTEYSQITISDISDRAGISRKSFYRYFNSKESCLCALLDHAIFDGASYYLPNHSDNQSPPFIYERFFRYWKDKQNLLDALDRNSMSTRLVEQMVRYVMQEEQDFKVFLKARDQEAHERNLFYIGGVMTLVFDWHKSRYSKSILQMSHILNDLI